MSESYEIAQLEHDTWASWLTEDVDKKRKISIWSMKQWSEMNRTMVQVVQKERFTPFPDSKTQFGLNQSPTQEEHLSSLIKDQPAVY